MTSKQLLIVYFSETGHTKAMATAIGQGARSVKGVDVLVKVADATTNDDLLAPLARSWRGEPGESEEMRPQWYAYEDVPQGEMWADDRIWLPRVLQGERLNGVFTFSDAETIVHQEITSWDG